MKALCKILFVVAATMLMTSCGAYIACYSIGLQSVESPADAKQQYGETKVINFQGRDFDGCRYEDDYIRITWKITTKALCFNLTNKSNYSIKLNWDDISYVDIAGLVRRVMHYGIKYNDRAESQPALTIPKGATLNDALIPTDNVHYDAKHISWETGYLIPSVYSYKPYNDSEVRSYVGKKMAVALPIIIEGVQNEYTFTFTIDDFLGYEYDRTYYK